MTVKVPSQDTTWQCVNCQGGETGFYEGNSRSQGAGLDNGSFVSSLQKPWRGGDKESCALSASQLKPRGFLFWLLQKSSNLET